MLRMRWWNRLGVKLAAAITLCSILTMALLLVLLLRSQRRHLLEQARRSAAIVSDTITRGIEQEMLHDRRAAAYGIMSGVGREPFIDHLRLFDAGGRVRFSTLPQEVGVTYNPLLGPCLACHRDLQPRGSLSTEERTRIITNAGRQVLGAVTLIYNKPSCSSAACHVHPAQQRVLGVVQLGLTLDAVDDESSTLQRTTIGLALLAALVLGTVTVGFIRRLVIRPVSLLVEGTRRVSGGNLAQHVPVTSSDELAVLEASFNTMELSLARVDAERAALLESLEQQVEERSAALERAQAQLIQTEKLSSLGRLSASIAHEINNPLAGILTIAKLLIRTIDEDPDSRQGAFFTRHLRLVQRETERCTAIVKNLLGFARERPLTTTDVDVNTALEEALFLTASQLALQDITLVRELAPVPPIRGDFGQIRQALANLLINACDAMGKQGTLRVRSGPGPEGMVTIAIQDSGCGIPAEILSKVLDPFFTTKEKGTGLGLSVVYGVVQRHQGRLDIASVPGEGTTVTIQLPLAPAPEPGPAATDPTRSDGAEPHHAEAAAPAGAAHGGS